MKILLPILGFGKGGGNRVLSFLASEFVKKGHEVHFLSPMQKEEPYFPTTAKIFYASISGKLYTRLNTANAIGDFPRAMAALVLGARNLRHQNYDIILANHSLTVYPVMLNQLKGKRFYYVQAYEPEYYQLLPGLKNRIFEWLSKKSYSFNFRHVVNSGIYSGYKNKIQNAPVVLPGMDLQQFYPAEKPAIGSRPLRIGTIWRPEPAKGSIYIMEAYQQIRQQHPEVEMVLAFATPEMAELPGVTVVQPHGSQALADFYRSLDVYICAGTVQHGAVHYPVIECLATGTSLITTHYFPADDNNAYMVEPYSAAAIVDGFNTWLADGQKRNERVQHGLDSVRQFSWDEVSKNFLNILSTYTV